MLPDPASLAREVLLAGYEGGDIDDVTVSTLTPPHIAERAPHVVVRRTGGRSPLWPVMDRASLLLMFWAGGYAPSRDLAFAGRDILLAAAGWSSELGRVHKVREDGAPVEVPGVAPDGLVRHDATYTVWVKPPRA